jgi:hypothetical protein
MLRLALFMAVFSIGRASLAHDVEIAIYCPADTAVCAIDCDGRPYKRIAFVDPMRKYKNSRNAADFTKIVAQNVIPEYSHTEMLYVARKPERIIREVVNEEDEMTSVIYELQSQRGKVSATGMSICTARSRYPGAPHLLLRTIAQRGEYKFGHSFMTLTSTAYTDEPGDDSFFEIKYFKNWRSSRKELVAKVYRVSIEPGGDINLRFIFPDRLRAAFKPEDISTFAVLASTPLQDPFGIRYDAPDDVAGSMP